MTDDYTLPPEELGEVPPPRLSDGGYCPMCCSRLDSCLIDRDGRCVRCGEAVMTLEDWCAWLAKAGTAKKGDK